MIQIYLNDSSQLSTRPLLFTDTKSTFPRFWCVCKELDSSILKRYVGAYKLANAQIDLKIKEGKLYIHFQDQIDEYEFKPESETKFFFVPSPDAYQYEFEVDNKGKVIEAYFISAGVKNEIKKM